MKHLLIAASIVFSFGALRAQCPGCTPFDCSATNPDGGLCDTLITGMANHLLDEQVSFYMPSIIYNATAPGGWVRLRRIKVTGITGLPLGLSWESNHAPANEYFPQSGDSIGCVRICGTPLQSGTYPLTVYLLADVTVISLNIDANNQAQTYNTAVVNVLADTSGGVSSFSVTPEIYSSCDPLTLAFEAKIDGSPNRTTYDWDFGNGNIGTGKNPSQQNYTAAAQYPVTLTTTIYYYVIKEVRVFDTNNSYTGDIEELTALQNPDLYFTVAELGYTSSSGSESKSAKWAGLHIVVPQGTNQITLQVWDDDNGPPFGSQDDTLGRVVINVALGTFLWDDDNGTVTNGVIVFDDTVGTVFSETLDIEIAATPTPLLALSAGDSICGGDTTVLSLSGSDIYQFRWYNDSVFLQDAVDTFYPATATGVYWIAATSAAGCNGVSDSVPVEVLPSPPVPAVNFNGANSVYASNSSPNFDLQWYFNGTIIPGANSYLLTVTDTGRYSAQYSYDNGCYSVSREVAVASIISGVGELNDVQMLVNPNPSKGVFDLTLDGVNSETVISITDLLGRAVYEKKDIPVGVFSTTVDLSQEPVGMYLCRVLSGKGQKVDKMLILK